MKKKGDDLIISKRTLAKNRKRRTVTTRIDVDLLEVIESCNLKLADTLNVALEKWLREKGLIKD